MSRIILIFFLSLVSFSSKGQQYSFNATSPIVEATMHKAVANAKKFILHTIAPEVFDKHFQLITSLSAVKSDYASYHYTPYMEDTISFIPSKYELRYLLRVGEDTLTESFVIPIDSLGYVDVDTSNFSHVLDDLQAYNKLFTGGYRFDFVWVKCFIEKNKLKNYSIVFMNSMSTLNYKNYKKLKIFKHYWYVIQYNKSGYSKTYIIDPVTGKVSIKNNKMKIW